MKKLTSKKLKLTLNTVRPLNPGTTESAVANLTKCTCTDLCTDFPVSCVD
ncbi:MAG TPA: hypothetical protein VK698_33015 [Kofleriaceae bacterium]|nr:hypothetical protein [Kofleriaceae bacterium]